MSPKGTILQCDVSGQIMMRSYLSGMPECKIGINDKLLYENKTQNAGSRQPSKTVELDDCQFHQCVKLGKFDANRTITFIPPDGEFELMRYRTTDNITLPFKVHAVVNELTSNRVEFRIAIRSTFNTQHIFAQKVSIHVPTPPNTVSASIGVSGGKAKYNGSENSLVWKMHRFPANGEFLMTAEATLASTTVKKQWSRPPITVDFQVLMFTGSGLQVRFLKIFEKSNYTTVKWVRYMTKAGSYQIRFWTTKKGNWLTKQAIKGIVVMGAAQSSEKKELRMVIMGPPGAGKGTQAPRIKDTYCVCHLATGDMLREAVRDGTSVIPRV